MSRESECVVLPSNINISIFFLVYTSCVLCSGRGKKNRDEVLARILVSFHNFQEISEICIVITSALRKSSIINGRRHNWPLDDV